TSGDYAKVSGGYFTSKDYDWSQWEYELDETAKTITLIQYRYGNHFTGNLIIPSYAIINDSRYDVILQGTRSSSKHTFPIVPWEASIIIEDGVKAAEDISYLFAGVDGNANNDDIILDVRGLDTSGTTNMSCLFSASIFSNVYLGDFDTSKATDMSYMFAQCLASSLDLSSFDTSNVVDMSGMFYNCLSETINLSSFKTSNVTDMSEMFALCFSLTALDVSMFDTSKVTDMSGMFRDCSSLSSLDLSSFDTRQVTNMSGMFGGYEGFDSLDLSIFDTSNVTDMSGMFGGAEKDENDEGETYWYDLTNTNLKKLNLGNFNTSKVTDMSYMFAGCLYLEALDMSSFDTSNVTDMSGMFAMHYDEEYERSRENSPRVKDLNLNDLNTSSVINMSNMFCNFYSLENLDLSGFDTSKVTDMSCMFAGCESMESLDLSGFVTSNVINMSNMFCMVQYVDDFPIDFTSKLKSLDLSGFNTEKVKYMSEMFRGCQSLESLDLSNFNTSNVTNMSYMFSLCGSLESLDLSGFNTDNVIDMTGMFSMGHEKASSRGYNEEGEYYANDDYYDYYASDISSLNKLDLRSFNTGKVISMMKMFLGCSNLDNLDLSSFDTSQTIDMRFMFAECGEMPESVNLSSFNTSNVINMEGMFQMGNYQNRDATLVPQKKTMKSLDLSSFNTEKVTNMTNMFADCINLKNLNLSGFSTENVENTDRMFYNCKELETLDLSSFDNSSFWSIEEMFSGCESLKKIYTFPGTDWSKTKYASDIFKGCTNLSGAISYDPEKISGAYAKVAGGYFSVKESPFEEDDFKDWVYRVDETKETITLIRYAGSGKRISIPAAGTLSGKKYAVVLQGTNSWYGNGTFPYDTEEIYVEEGVRAAENASCLFYGLSKLRALDVSELDTSETVRMAWMFRDCAALSELDVAGFDTSKVKYMQYMFAGCAKLSALDVGKLDTSSVGDMRGMFRNCASLAKLNVSGFDTRNATDFSEMFQGCSRLKELDVSKLNGTKARKAAAMFRDCGALELLDLSGFSAPLLEDISEMFAGCGKLQTIYVSSELVDWGKAAKGKDGTFTGCRLLQGYASEKTSGDYAKANVNGGYFMAKPPDPYVSVTVEFFSEGRVITTKKVYLGTPYGLLPVPPDREGWAFTGWLFIDGEGESSITVPITEDTVVFRPYRHQLTAAWEKVPAKMKVTFMPRGGILPEGMDEKTVTEGEAYGYLPVPEKAGSAFLGWFDAEKGGMPVTENDTVSATKDYALYAYYDTDEVLITVTFDAGGGTVFPSSMAAQYGKPYGNLPIPSRTGFAFNGWFLEASDPYPLTAETKVKKAWSHSLHAHWKKEGEPWHLSFYYDGRLLQQLDAQDGAAVLETPKIPDGDGVFSGWYDLESGSYWDQTSPVYRDMALEARFLKAGGGSEWESSGSGKDPGLILSGTDLYMVKGQSYLLPAQYADGRNITWKSSEKGIVAVSGKNKAKAKKVTDERIQSNASLDVSTKARVYDIEEVFSYTVHIADPYLGDENGQPVRKTLTMLPGERVSLSMQGFGALEGMYDTAWQSANSGVARVDNGIVTAVAKGSAKITASVNGKAYTATVKVADTRKPGKIARNGTLSLMPLQTVSLSFQEGFKVKNASYTAAGESQALVPLLKNGKVYAYQNNVARITTAGKLTAVGTGTTTLTAKAPNGEERTFTVSVSAPAQATVYLNAGQTKTISHYGVKSKKAKWDLLFDEDNVLKKFESGKVSAGKNVSGRAVVSCEYDPYYERGVDGTGFTYTTVICVEDLKFQTGAWLQETKAGSSYELTLTQGVEYLLKTEGVFQPVVFESNKPQVAFADEAGVVHARGKGKATLKAKVNGKQVKVLVVVQ
ncbi:MAG: BspA family leucine-rich repeat surface protein, partial [Lachnospiraceae bacterium]|nr:BspA family leucine-rich repeat surface protein [Lachnospiraceae bacterium]